MNTSSIFSAPNFGSLNSIYAYFAAIMAVAQAAVMQLVPGFAFPQLFPAATIIVSLLIYDATNWTGGEKYLYLLFTTCVSAIMIFVPTGPITTIINSAVPMVAFVIGIVFPGQIKTMPTSTI